VTFTVNAMPLVVITNPTSAQTFGEVTNITLRATNYDSDGVVTNVKFYCAGTNLLGTVTPNAGYWSFVWTNRHAGTNPVTAIAMDNRGASSPSAITLVKVTPLHPPPGFPSHIPPVMPPSAPTATLLFPQPLRIGITPSPMSSSS